MKTISKINSLLVAVFFLLAFATGLSMYGVSLKDAIVTMVLITIVGSILAKPIANASGYAITGTIYRQVWTGEVLKKAEACRGFQLGICNHKGLQPIRCKGW